jgi:hypothetical protein
MAAFTDVASEESEFAARVRAAFDAHAQSSAGIHPQPTSPHDERRSPSAPALVISCT